MNTLPSTDRLYRALVERDSAFEGVFLVGVKTTGIFCRAGCTAKRPRRENCEFFATPQEALHAGYRACRRCRPLDGGRQPPASVQKLLNLVDEDPGRRIVADDLRQLGIEPSTARRQFLRHCGMTFHAYQRARRMGRALQDFRRHRDLPRAMDEAGYESFSGFGAAFAGLFGKPPSSAKQVNCLLADWIMTPLGGMVAIASDEGLCLLEFQDRRALKREIAWLQHRFAATVVPGKNAALRRIAVELEEYFAGRRTRFETPLVLSGSEFQIRVWKELLKIEAGQTRSYTELAAAIGRPGAQRAVGRANGDNRLALVVPCHRVIRSDGAPCGYGGGLWRKRRLLEHEARMVGAPEGVCAPQSAEEKDIQSATRRRASG
jgi:AraC family transcriptional regulator of adaptative response/methylated-DNA-[protein]-cysteine methyltransferase